MQYCIVQIASVKISLYMDKIFRLQTSELRISYLSLKSVKILEN